MTYDDHEFNAASDVPLLLSYGVEGTEDEMRALVEEHGLEDVIASIHGIFDEGVELTTQAIGERLKETT